MFAAIYQARRQSLDIETTRALSYARGVVHRADATVLKIRHGIDEIKARWRAS